MRGILKIAALAGGGLLLWPHLQDFLSGATGQALTTTPTAPAPPIVKETPPEPAPAPAPPLTQSVRQQVAAAAQKDGLTMLTWDQWNFYYAQIRGASAGGWDEANTGGRPREYRMTLDEWYSTVAPWGLSGVYRLVGGRR